MASSFDFDLIDFPGAESTEACGINDRGQIVGGYWDTNVELGKAMKMLREGGTLVVWWHILLEAIRNRIRQRYQVLYTISGGESPCIHRTIGVIYRLG